MGDPGRDEHRGAGGQRIAAQFDRLDGGPAADDEGGRVKAQGFVNDRGKIGKRIEVFGSGRAAGENAGELFVEAGFGGGILREKIQVQLSVSAVVSCPAKNMVMVSSHN